MIRHIRATLLITVLLQVRGRLLDVNSPESAFRDTSEYSDSKIRIMYSVSFLLYKWGVQTLEDAFSKELESTSQVGPFPPEPCCTNTCTIAATIVNVTQNGEWEEYSCQGRPETVQCARIDQAATRMHDTRSHRALDALTGVRSVVLMPAHAVQPPLWRRRPDPRALHAGLALLCLEPQCAPWASHWASSRPFLHPDVALSLGWSPNMSWWLPLDCGMVNELAPIDDRGHHQQRLLPRPDPQSVFGRVALGFVDPRSARRSAALIGAVASFVSSPVGGWRGRLMQRLASDAGITLHGYGRQGPQAPLQLRAALTDYERVLGERWAAGGGSKLSHFPGKISALQWYAATLAVENSALPGYRSEKVLDSILARVPLVLTAGDPHIGEWLQPYRAGQPAPEVLVVDMARLPLSAGLAPEAVLWGTAGVGIAPPIPVPHVAALVAAALDAAGLGAAAVVEAALGAARAIPGAGRALFRGRLQTNGATARRCRHLEQRVWPTRRNPRNATRGTNTKESVQEWMHEAAGRLRLTADQGDLLCSVCEAVRDSARKALQEQHPW